MRLAEQDIDWHDGNLVDIHVAGSAGPKQTLRLFLDLYPDERRRPAQALRCTGEDLASCFPRPPHSQARKSGNIDFMRVEPAPTRNPDVSLSAGGRSRSATFHLTEAP